MVQIRHPDTHEALPGIEVGDIGGKFGYFSKDNGFMLLHNVRIPRKNMLMKYAHVDAEGNFEIRGDLRILYSTMLAIRCSIVGNCYKGLSN